jgi:GNAT superfamily N-acetyltransferase
MQIRPGKAGARPKVVVDSLANHPDLVSQVVEIAWSEWGGGLIQGDCERWLREAHDDCRSNSKFSAGFVALSADVPVGTVQLHEFDLEHMQDRSPWVCGMVVASDYRGLGIGRRLLQALEAFSRSRGVERLWVFTESAAAFYERCGWSPYETTSHHGEPGTVLTKKLAA